MCAYSINQQICDLVGSLGMCLACAMPRWHRTLSSSATPPSSPPLQGLEGRGVTMRSFSLRAPSLPCSSHPDSHIQTSVPIAGQVPGSQCEDGQEHTMASLPLTACLCLAPPLRWSHFWNILPLAPFTFRQG